MQSKNSLFLKRYNFLQLEKIRFRVGILVFNLFVFIFCNFFDGEKTLFILILIWLTHSNPSGMAELVSLPDTWPIRARQCITWTTVHNHLGRPLITWRVVSTRCHQSNSDTMTYRHMGSHWTREQRMQTNQEKINEGGSRVRATYHVILDQS